MLKRNNWRLTLFMMAVVAMLAACDTGTSPASKGSAASSSGGASSAGSAGNSGKPAKPEGRPVVAETLPYAEVAEQLVHGHFAFPADMVDPLPGIIVIHERWGLDDRTRALADRLAGQGYVVLAVDLFGGKTASDINIARNLMVNVVENPELANENIRQAYQFLKDSGQAPSIGALGWSFGGNWALNTAMLFPDELGAAVIYYGQVSNNEDRLAPMNVPILGLFGENDKGVTVETVREFEQTLDALGKNYEIEIYEGAGHAFADPDGSNYNAEIAELAWARVLGFLDYHLSKSAN
jgi:carboxymethylenebutenolidase